MTHRTVPTIQCRSATTQPTCLALATSVSSMRSKGMASRGVVIDSLPSGGQLLVDRSPVLLGDEVSIEDITAGKFQFVPEPGFSDRQASSSRCAMTAAPPGSAAGPTLISPQYLHLHG